MKSLIVFLMSLGLAASAQAQSWTKAPDATSPRCGNIIGPGGFCYYVITNTSNADSPLMQILNLADACFDPKLDGTGTATAQVAIRKCQSDTISANNCERITVDVDGDGDVDNGILDGDSGSVSFIQRMCIYDLGPGYFHVEVSTNPGAADTAVLTLTGH